MLKNPSAEFCDYLRYWTELNIMEKFERKNKRQ